MNAMKTYEEENWPKLSPAFREVHNKLRVMRGMSPIPAPKIDLYVPPPATPTPLPFDPADPEAIAVELELCGLGDQTPDGGEIAKQLASELADWKNITKRLALELAHKQLADRQLRTKELYHAIAQFVAVAKEESGKSRKWIIGKAIDHYGVSKRTIETAIAEFPAELYFTNRIELSPTVTVFRYLPIELRLLALGLSPPR
jgi:hypothetical protein